MTGVAYHRFAEQTLVLSSQIARTPARAGPQAPEAEPVISLAGLRVPRPLMVAAAAVVGIPLFAGGLAAAGLKLPELANESVRGRRDRAPEPGRGAGGGDHPGQDDRNAASRRCRTGPAGGGRRTAEQRAIQVIRAAAPVEPSRQSTKPSVPPEPAPSAEPAPPAEPVPGGDDRTPGATCPPFPRTRLTARWLLSRSRTCSTARRRGSRTSWRKSRPAVQASSAQPSAA